MACDRATTAAWVLKKSEEKIASVFDRSVHTSGPNATALSGKIA